MLRISNILFYALLIGLMPLASCTKSHPHIFMLTSMGSIEIELYSDKAPITANNFIRYVKENRFDSATFYRSVNDENQDKDAVKIQVVQGGLFDDHHPKMLAPIALETTEQTGVHHRDGVISMARNEPGSATSEFFICIGDQPELDYGGKRNPDGQGFAAFGKVVKGMEVVRQIWKAPAKGQYLEPRIEIYKMIYQPE